MKAQLSRASLAALVCMTVVVGCVTVGPSPAPSSSLAPGATVPPSSLATAGATAPSVTLAPGVTEPAATAPPPTSATTDAPPTSTTTEPPTDDPGTNPNWPPGAVSGRNSGDHVGETIWVCGRVVQTNWLFDEPGHPTWLNFGRAYPNQRFNAVIWGEQRRDWPLSGKPEVVYLDKIVCVYGLIESYNNKPQIQDLSMANIMVIP